MMDTLKNIIIICFIISIVVCIIGILFCILMLAKNKNTFHMRKIIIDAIYRYQINQFYNGNFLINVDYDDMEEYDATMYRLHDWGYKNILPPDKFEIIKPYIGRR